MVTRTVTSTATRTVTPDPEDPRFFIPRLDDDEPDSAFSDVFEALRGETPNCAKALIELDEDWRQYGSPQGVVLSQAAIYACEGDRGKAAETLNYVEAKYGLLFSGGASTLLSCDVYRALARYLESYDPSCGWTAETGTEWEESEEANREDPRLKFPDQ
ncbi:hypothetical protein [Kineosporia babensis]|uniref:Uncharacterized protein n=1 Tax=Kineosporia babensis TaxID=499548 RepID=A0A9X1NLQ1_9ACTN|nr:hypothetical protein [Kineosporia babensis]MCD5317282.1 hypothetical protein [Kineosporia babensis]